MPRPVAPSAVAAQEPAPKAVPAPAPTLHTAQKPWAVWIGLAAAGGVGLRFVQLPDFALPVVVGLAVTAAVTLALHLGMGQNAGEKNAAANLPPPGRPTDPHKKSPR